MIFFSSLSSNLKWTKIWGKKQTNKKKKTVFAVHAFDTAATLKKKKKNLKVIKPDTNWQALSKVIIMQRIKDFAYIVSENTRTLTFCQTGKHVSYLP